MLKFALFVIVSANNIAFASPLTEKIAVIETQIKGNFGIAVLDTSNNNYWQYKGTQQLPLMSTFKTLACAKLLHDATTGFSNKTLTYPLKKQHLVTWSPITKHLVGKNISAINACHATMTTSDNTAANIVLTHIGGPTALTQYIRSLGILDIRIDRFEPELNEAKSGDLRDTTTAIAMVNVLQQILLTDRLSATDKTQLIDWMQQNTVSDALLRSILPEGWNIADRTGAGENGSRGIAAMIWRDENAPILLAIYITEVHQTIQQRNQIIIEIGKLLFEHFNITAI